MEKYFVQSQFVLISILVLILFIVFRPKKEKSNFKVREADKHTKNNTTKFEDELAKAKIKRKTPLLLQGISITGLPHEILGVPSQPTVDEVKKAYRELMKRYHPDKLGKPGSQAWRDGQKIAEAINKAKDALLKKSK